VIISTNELGDGATSRVFLGEMNGKMVAVKKAEGLFTTSCIFID